MSDRLSLALAAVLYAARTSRDLSAAALAERSGVSRTMIGKIERGEAQPTAALLGRLSGALGMTLSELVARAEGTGGRLVRAADQPTWTDPDSGYRRRAVSPDPGGPLELVEIHLPAGARIAYPTESYAFLHHQIWVLTGTLHFEEGEVLHELGVGDCLQLGSPQPCAYVNPTDHDCRYLVALARRS
ncbi:helix-turn-helix domain-containing protein [Pseudonocardia abyssalis]|uniref:Helix-turn-helix domain-containing protein n=1 Tax=Pseudonocardia abyssalis TaxID=2792008 RepID=A0ABS6UP08_9PSEU|nr:XRE family transcriptional regulator [Pseudonocardia abyssalis]MBW0118516.1 helix-turn-helix domain-containing protein [Pseudonocardia abyssalis]MBW0133987.1 helix-turn-helix domain-containing protein [Pseudonocardia abyssalis]